jgi:hypothetical protein
MGSVKYPLLCAIAVYVTLDLSLAVMPGAFVFDAGDSVESVQMSRGRAAAEVVVVPAPASGWIVVSQPATEVTVRAAAGNPEQRRQPRVTNRLLRPPDPGRSRPSEDPH